jgi:hypothetical protein
MTSDVSSSLDSIDIEVSGLQKKQTRLKEELNLKVLLGLVCPTTIKEMKVEFIIPPTVLIAEKYKKRTSPIESVKRFNDSTNICN